MNFSLSDYICSMKIVFASQNPKKLTEIRAVLPDNILLEDLSSFPVHEEIPETGSTLEENALQKARYVFERFGVNCVADDTGLEITALKGRPGVFSARYAGEQKDPEANMDKVLEELRGMKDRSARFRTVFALILDGKEYLFDGEVHGHITEERRGDKGFGYDPVFQPEGFEVTFAEMEATEKNKLSHRSRATEKMVAFLESMIS